MTFGERLRELRQNKGLTLRGLADATGLSFTYLSKIETSKVPYTPSVEKIRDIAEALAVDSLELLQAADKVPPEIAELTGSPQARRFIERAREIASPGDWEALLDVLERRRAKREKGNTD